MTVSPKKGLKKGVFSLRIVELGRYITSVAKIENIVKSTMTDTLFITYRHTESHLYIYKKGRRV